jgi:hypothetical protein
MTIAEIDLAGLKELLAKATPGPLDEFLVSDIDPVIEFKFAHLVATFVGDGCQGACDDIAYFRALRNAAPALIAAAEERDVLRAMVAELETECSRLKHTVDDKDKTIRLSVSENARLSALVPVWRDIASAPRDGTPVDLKVRLRSGKTIRIPNCKRTVDGWLDEHNAYVTVDDGASRATHWMPLPDVP